MRKIELLKNIVENETLKEKYWPTFKTEKDIRDYSKLIVMSNNKYLMALRNILNPQEDRDLSSGVLYKKILNQFNL